MPAEKTNIYIDKGTDYLIELLIDSDEVDYDFDDYEFACAASKLYSSDVIIEAEVTKVPSSNTNPIDTIELFFSANNTVDLIPGKYVYDVLMKNTVTSETDKILEGLLFITPTITTI